VALQPPRGLTPTARAAWRHARDVLLELGERPELSRGALDRYADAVDMAVRLRAELRDDEFVLHGPRGGVRVHPLVREVEKAAREAHLYAESLGLSPVARRKLGMRFLGGRPPGAASAPDRAAKVVVPLRRRLRGEP
jgi:P27 family predicted phage terminase small subunit